MPHRLTVVATRQNHEAASIAFATSEEVERCSS